ncbi:MAG: hypothetical protein IPF92_14000 [Myxococcales bacterium]|jgi:hypothetical protein|nr:hypothetical protein [Myxococcales bacterium]MBL0194989.1 hypothetical protein [Myxococcales bacterium]
MLPGSRAFGRWAGLVYSLAAAWLVGVVALAAWPTPGKYPLGLAAWVLAVLLVVGSLKLWIDDLMGLAGATLVLGGLALASLHAWHLPKSALAAFLGSLLIPGLALLTALRAAGSADSPYEEPYDDP